MKKLIILIIMLTITFLSTYSQKVQYQVDKDIEEHEKIIAMKVVDAREYFWTYNIEEREEDVTQYLANINLY